MIATEAEAEHGEAAGQEECTPHRLHPLYVSPGNIHVPPAPGREAQLTGFLIDGVTHQP
jgi:hypothetical protein